MTESIRNKKNCNVKLSTGESVVITPSTPMPKVQLIKEDGTKLTTPVAYPKFRKDFRNKLLKMQITSEEVIQIIMKLDDIINSTLR